MPAQKKPPAKTRVTRAGSGATVVREGRHAASKDTVKGTVVSDVLSRETRSEAVPLRLSDAPDPRDFFDKVKEMRRLHEQVFAPLLSWWNEDADVPSSTPDVVKRISESINAQRHLGAAKPNKSLDKIEEGLILSIARKLNENRVPPEEIRAVAKEVMPALRAAFRCGSEAAIREVRDCPYFTFLPDLPVGMMRDIMSRDPDGKSSGGNPHQPYWWNVVCLMREYEGEYMQERIAKILRIQEILAQDFPGEGRLVNVTFGTKATVRAVYCRSGKLIPKQMRAFQVSGKTWESIRRKYTARVESTLGAMSALGNDMMSLLYWPRTNDDLESVKRVFVSDNVLEILTWISKFISNHPPNARV
ncbi:MAG: hypothetical protein AUJ92_10585 [Armatimonadetes bacterium CG2_30_59_28]|nr:hypothetical protein [Armatimonadota bacterium]OIO94203.1 MAG: hypothetical protein AUJ92_10585 [Armatimonadetes bacterium CG2_30_59_28]PIU61104.1 MAG: hypothetical protein COS85_21785 [Armatimonadetes bacterium CG07_land_8_20_14_0_80_59_28]